MATVREPGLDRGSELAPAVRDVGRRRARADEDGGDGAPRSVRGEGRPHRQDRRAARAVGVFVQNDVAVAPAAGGVRKAASQVGRRRAAVAVLVQPVVVRLEHRGQAAGPDRTAVGDRGATGDRSRKARVGAAVGAALRVPVQLRGDVVDRREATVDAFVVHHREDLLVERQGIEGRLRQVHVPDAFVAARAVDRGEPVGAVRRDVGRRAGGRQNAGARRRCTGDHTDAGQTQESGRDGEQKCRDTAPGTAVHAGIPLFFFDSPTMESVSEGIRRATNRTF